MVVLIASALQSLVRGSISLSSHIKRLAKRIFTAHLLGARHKMNCLEGELENFLVLSLGKTFNRIPVPLSLCGRQKIRPK